MAVELFLFVGLAIAVSVGLLRFYPEQTRRALRIINTSRAVVFGVLWVSTAAVFVASGSPMLVFLGVLMFVLVFVQILVEDLHIKAREVIGL